MMRKFAGAIMACALACSGSVAEPATVLPVEFEVNVIPAVPPTATLDHAGTDVSGTIVRPTICGYTNGGSATLSGSDLSVTVTLTIREIGGICTALPAVSYSFAYHMAVHGVPSGSYAASLHLRIVNGLTTVDSVVASQRLVLP